LRQAAKAASWIAEGVSSGSAVLEERVNRWALTEQFAELRIRYSSKWKLTATGRVYRSAIGSLPYGTSVNLPTRSPLLLKECLAMMPKDLKELLLAFNEHGVRYLIVGGYAFGAHAEPRATKDLDVFIATDELNSSAVYRALADYGAPLDGLTPSDFRDDSGFQIGQPPARIDILQRISGIAFEDAWENRVEGLIDGEVVAPVISRGDLIRNKLEAGRDQDLLDVRALRAAGGEGP
jgi:hypothetical protein